ncbi:MAG: polysaccharide biosynthesis/export family protein, partial [Planctomycetaceae bacterium]|nr:polysaccharide biosynthesis/export family protein [Planctomycetaceae bacterium]
MRINTFYHWALFLLMCSAMTGCTSIPDRETISPAHVSNMRQKGSRSLQEQINFIGLRQDPPEQYLLGPGDTLGIYIERVTANETDPLPVLTPPEGTGLPPAVGIPVTIADDGTLSLPMILGPLYLEGMTLVEAEEEIRKAYTEIQKILPPNARIIISLYKPRTYRVLVIREDVQTDDMRYTYQNRGKGEAYIGHENRGTAKALELYAYQNDVLQALCETGGLPSNSAKNEVIILRGAFADAKGSNSLISQYANNGSLQGQDYNPNITRIPLRANPGDVLPDYTQEDIILKDGDVVVIQSREAEVFYTGGLLQGGMFPIPRDFDLDVFG